MSTMVPLGLGISESLKIRYQKFCTKHSKKPTLKKHSVSTEFHYLQFSPHSVSLITSGFMFGAQEVCICRCARCLSNDAWRVHLPMGSFKVQGTLNTWQHWAYVEEEGMTALCEPCATRWSCWSLLILKSQSTFDLNSWIFMAIYLLMTSFL